MSDVAWGIIGAFVFGLWLGKSDHEYMNRKASGGKLYIVRREP